MDEEAFIQDLDIDTYEQLPCTEDETQEFEFESKSQFIGFDEAETNYLSALLENEPQNLLGIEVDDHLIVDSGSNSWNLIRSAVDTLTDISENTSLKSFEQEGLEDLLALDSSDFDVIFQRLPQPQTKPESNTSDYSGALLHDIDIAAELLDELYQLNLEEKPEPISDPTIDEITSTNTLFDIYSYCQPCEDKSLPISDFDYTASEAILIPMVRAVDHSELKDSDTMYPMDQQDDDGRALDFQQPAMLHAIISSFPGDPKKERAYLGHKETVFGMSFSPCGRFVATASQDSTIRIWSCASNILISTLTAHNKKYECLRVAWASTYWVERFKNLCVGDSDAKTPALVLSSAGADGTVKVWQSLDDANSWTCLCTLEHLSSDQLNETDKKDDAQDNQEDKEKPQIYSIQFIDEWKPSQSPILSSNFNCPSCLLTSSDDFVHLWEPKAMEQDINQLLMSRIMSIRFTHLDMGFGGVFVLFSGDDSKEVSNTFAYPRIEMEVESSMKAFGGARNPDNLTFVFDANYCPSNGLLGVALSDGSLRLVNGRGSCVYVLQLPEFRARLTSFTWDTSGQRLASCVATGQIILWSISSGEMNSGRTEASCYAVLEGGHSIGRPLYGVRFLGTEQNLLVSWGIDGKLCLWASRIGGNVTSPLTTLVSKSDYPIYAADVTDFICVKGEVSSLLGRIGIAGGSDGGFIGIPFYLYDVMS